MKDTLLHLTSYRKPYSDALMNVVHVAFEPYKECLNCVYKSITADSDSEFTNLSELKELDISVYFTHPYSSYEKGTNECHNRMFLQFISKGKRIEDYSKEDIAYLANLINGLLRKKIGYSTQEALFVQKLDRIFSLDKVA